MAVPDEYLAFNGTTVLGQIDNLKRENEGRDRDRDREKNMTLKDARPLPPLPPLLLKKHQSTKQYKMVPTSNNPSTSAWNGTQSVPLSRAATPPCLPRLPGGLGAEKKGREKGLGKRKSFFNFWGGGRRDGGAG